MIRFKHILTYLGSLLRARLGYVKPVYQMKQKNSGSNEMDVSLNLNSMPFLQNTTSATCLLNYLPTGTGETEINKGSIFTDMEHAVQQEHLVERSPLEGYSSLLQVGDFCSLLGFIMRSAGHTHLSDTQEDAYSCVFLTHIAFFLKKQISLNFKAYSLPTIFVSFPQNLCRCTLN